jgi:hypothetical protein
MLRGSMLNGSPEPSRAGSTSEKYTDAQTERSRVRGVILRWEHTRAAKQQEPAKYGRIQWKFVPEPEAAERGASSREEENRGREDGSDAPENYHKAAP